MAIAYLVLVFILVLGIHLTDPSGNFLFCFFKAFPENFDYLF